MQLGLDIEGSIPELATCGLRIFKISRYSLNCLFWPESKFIHSRFGLDRDRPVQRFGQAQVNFSLKKDA